MFAKTTYDKLLKDIPKAKLITIAVVSERLKVNGSVAEVAIRHLEGRAGGRRHGRTDERTDGRTVVQTSGRTDARTKQVNEQKEGSS